MKKIVFLFVSVFCLSGCYKTDWTVMSGSANVEDYHYAIMTYAASGNSSATLTDLEFEVYDALSATRLEVIGEGLLPSFSDIQKQQLLTVRVSTSRIKKKGDEQEKTAVTIDFADYMTGKPVASCKGVWGWGVTEKRDLKVATEKAIGEMNNLF
jgi:hypothetical protein